MQPTLTLAQLVTLRTFILAQPALAGYVAAGDDGSIAAWMNADSATVAWRRAVYADDLFVATPITKFDTLSAGKRDSWRMMLEFAPIDFTRGKMRSAVTDVWGAADAATILPAFVRTASVAEELFGGNDRTEATIIAKVLNNEGELTASEVAQAMRG